MRKIEKQIVQAVNDRQNFKGGNTEVRATENTVSVVLHGSEIFRKVGESVFFTLAGWSTPTTCGRLRALGVRVVNKGRTPYVHGRAILFDKVYAIDAGFVGGFREESAVLLHGPNGRKFGGV